MQARANVSRLTDIVASHCEALGIGLSDVQRHAEDLKNVGSGMSMFIVDC